MRRTRLLPLMALALSASLAAQAKKETTDEHSLRYLTSAQVHEDVMILPPPTLPGSPEDIADRQVTERVYESRDAAMAAEAKAFENFEDGFAFAPAIGPGFRADRLPRTAALLEEVRRVAAVAKREGKSTWKRERPCPVMSCQWDPEGDATRDWKKRDYGYPSGHATRANIFAVVLDELVPGRASQVDALARRVDFSRVVRGVHTPQDVWAGRTLGRKLAHDLLANPQFRRDLLAARSELEAAGIR